jgi:hypothetical protein
MSRTKCWKWCLCALAIQLACVSRGFGVDPDIRASFLSAYRKAYDKLVQKYTNIEYRYLREIPLGKKLVDLTSLEGKFNLHYYLGRYEGRVAKSDTRETTIDLRPLIVAANTKYTFELADYGERYVVRKVEMLSANGRADFMPFMAPIADCRTNRTYLEIAEDPETEFISMTDTKFRGLSVKQLTLVVPYFNIITKTNTRSKKSYFFLPERGWLCVGWTQDIEPGSKYIEEFYEYEGEGAYPPLKLIEETRRDRQEPTASELACRIEFTKFTRVPPLDEAEFRLSAFGLPEPLGVTWSKPTPWYLWLSLAGVLCLMGGGVFYRLKRRAAAKVH